MAVVKDPLDEVRSWETAWVEGGENWAGEVLVLVWEEGKMCCERDTRGYVEGSIFRGGCEVVVVPCSPSFGIAGHEL